MKKIFWKINLTFTAIFTMLLIACEQTVENPELPYKEQLVIRIVLNAGLPVEDIEITKTLPPLENYDYDSALVKDAEAVIKSDGVAYPLIYDPAYQKYYAENLIPEPGKKYTLEVKSKKMLATASTIIPEPVEIDTFYYEFSEQVDDWGYKSWQYIVYAEFKPYSGFVYIGSSYEENGFDQYFTDEIFRSRDTLKNGKISQQILYYYPYDTTNFKERINNYTAEIYAFDQQFYNYFITQWEGGSGDDIFGTTGVNVRGNIKGGIGLFIGTAVTRKKIVIK